MGLFAGTQWDVPAHCERCGNLESECNCPPPEKVLTPPDKQTARVKLEKRKKGKVVTVVLGLAAEDNDLPKLLSKLQTSCGAGGSLQEEGLELQGDHQLRVRELLAQIGYRVR